MYGLVHMGLRQMVTEHLGPSAWPRICDKCGIKSALILSATEAFLDDDTFRLIKQSASEFDLSVNEFMEQFGLSWIRFVGRGKYASLLEACGKDLGEFFENVNTLHSSLAHVIPHARIGQFRVKEKGQEWILLRYSASRENVEYFVRGLVKGVCEYLGLECEITMVVQDPLITEMLVKTRFKRAI